MHWFAALTAVAALLLLSPPGAAASSSLSDGAAAGPAAPPSCTLVGDLQRGASSRGTNLTPEGLSGAAAATPQACQTACCAHTDCAAFTHSSSQRTATKNCAHGAPCCWLKGSYTSAIGDDNETSGQIHRPPNRASPASVPIRVLTDVTIVKAPDGPATNLTAGDHATCTLTAAAGGWERQPETFAGGVVLNASAVRCKVNASADLGGLASLTAVATCVCAPALALLCFSVTAFDACYSCSEIECRLCVFVCDTQERRVALSGPAPPPLTLCLGRAPAIHGRDRGVAAGAPERRCVSSSADADTGGNPAGGWAPARACAERPEAAAWEDDRADFLPRGAASDHRPPRWR